MRCLTLAEALSRRGAEVRFVCRETVSELLEPLRRVAMPVTCLPGALPATAKDADYAGWLGVSQARDAQQMIEALAGERPDWLVVDHYGLDAEWERRLRPYVERMMVIDDLANRHHDCDLLLDQNLGRKPTDYVGLVPDKCQLLIGPQYALLRPEFAALRDYSLQRRKEPHLKRLLVTMGGVDQSNATGKVLEALKECPLPSDCQITVVIGVRAPWLESVRSLAATLPWRTEVRVDVTDMARVMADSDLAIGAAGSTSWERCCLGLPTLVVVLAENQRAVARLLEEQQAVATLHLGASMSKQLSEQINRMVHAPHIIRCMAKRAATITDGLGCERVLAHVVSVPAHPI
jgi:pseudaminic acid biosynthesis-associated protein PseG